MIRRRALALLLAAAVAGGSVSADERLSVAARSLCLAPPSTAEEQVSALRGLGFVEIGKDTGVLAVLSDARAVAQILTSDLDQNAVWRDLPVLAEKNPVNGPVVPDDAVAMRSADGGLVVLAETFPFTRGRTGLTCVIARPGPGTMPEGLAIDPASDAAPWGLMHSFRADGGRGIAVVPARNKAGEGPLARLGHVIVTIWTPG